MHLPKWMDGGSILPTVDMWLPSFLRKRPRIYLISCAGLRNFGDDAIARYWVEELLRRYPRADIILESLAEGRARRMYKGVRCVSLMWPWVFRLRETGCDIRQIWNDVQVDDRLRVLHNHLPAELDAIHVVGGGYLNDLWAPNLLMLKLAVGLARRTGAQLTASGAGMTPLSEDSLKLIVPVLEEFDHLDFRDAQTMARLTGAGLSRREEVSCTIDDLVTAVNSGGKHFRTVSRPPRINICAHREAYNDGHQAPDVLPALANAIQSFRLMHPNAEIVFHQFYPESDSAYVERISSLFGQCRVISFKTIWRKGFDLSPGDLFLSTRFHFHLICSLQGLSGKTYVWNDYYRTKLQSILGLGRGHQELYDLREGPCIEGHPLTPEVPQRNLAMGLKAKERVIDRMFPHQLAAHHARREKMAGSTPLGSRGLTR